MSAHADLPRIVATLLALLSGYLVWRASDFVVDLLQLPDLLPIERLGAVVLGVSCLEIFAERLRHLYLKARAPQAGESR